jgi:hypothetical protein
MFLSKLAVRFTTAGTPARVHNHIAHVSCIMIHVDMYMYLKVSVLTEPHASFPR